MLHEKSCGAIVYRKYHGNTEILLIKHINSGHWSFPKGHVEAGETEVETARREIMEETSIDVIIDPTGSSVAVRFDVTLDVSGLSQYDAINFTSAYRVVNGEEVSEGMVRTADHTYSGVISLSDVTNGVASTMRFYIGWEEEETEEGDVSDTQLGNVKDVTADLPVNVVISQYSGETLEEYQP